MTTPGITPKPTVSLLPLAWGGPFLWVLNEATRNLMLLKADDLDSVREKGLIR